MTRRFRVLHLITLFPLSSGAAENTKLTVNSLDRSRFDVSLGTSPGQSMDCEVAADVKRVHLPWLKRAVHPLTDALAFWSLVRMLRRERYDVVHTHNAKDGILGRWAAFVAGVPAIIHTVHNVSFRASKSRFINSFYAWQERLAARVTHRILAVSEQNARSYLSRGIGRPEQYRTVYSGLDLARYSDASRSRAENREVLSLPSVSGPWVGWIGRFNPQKDPLAFVLAARQVKDRIPDVQFVVCGDDPLRPSLEGATRALAQEVGLSESMHFLGFQRDIATVLRSVDVVMHSSLYEGMGRTICEALACERPVAATAVDGVVEVIVSGERGGLLVPPRDPEALAAATCRLLTERDLSDRLARAGREWVERELSSEKMVDGINAIYLELLVKTPSSERLPTDQETSC